MLPMFTYRERVIGILLGLLFHARGTFLGSMALFLSRAILHSHEVGLIVKADFCRV